MSLNVIKNTLKKTRFFNVFFEYSDIINENKANNIESDGRQKVISIESNSESYEESAAKGARN